MSASPLPRIMSTRRVLVADDDKNIRLTLAATLADMGFDVVTVINGWEAVYEVRKPHPDGPFWLVLMDYQMPGMDGLEALNDIHEEFPGVHLAMITANGSMETAVEAMKAGAAEYLAKPFTPADLSTLVRTLEAKDAAAG